MHMVTGEVLFVQTRISEDPCGDVRPCAHDVLHIQTGLQTSFTSSLGAYNSIHLRQMLEGSTIYVHELSQVGGVEVLLQKLQEKADKKRINRVLTVLTPEVMLMN